MLVKHRVKGVRNVAANVGRAMIEADVAFACDEAGEPLKKTKPKAAGKRPAAQHKDKE